jgi:hypothetical protein
VDVSWYLGFGMAEIKFLEVLSVDIAELSQESHAELLLKMYTSAL